MLSRLIKHKVHHDSPEDIEDEKRFKASMKAAKAGEKNRDWPGAAELYEEALHTMPSDEKAHCGLCRCLMLSGDTKRAREEYETAAKMHPNAVLPRLGYARSMQMAGHLAQAVEQCRMALKSDPNHLMSAHILHGQAAGLSSQNNVVVPIVYVSLFICCHSVMQ
jgi:Tfp pilus assembly protein PilF